MIMLEVWTLFSIAMQICNAISSLVKSTIKTAESEKEFYAVLV